MKSLTKPHTSTHDNSLYAKAGRDDTFFSEARLKSFRYAWSGIVVFFAREQHAKIHLVSAIGCILLSIWFRIEKWEIIAILFSIAFVWISEMFNTVLEKTMDMISPEWHPQVKVIKDIAAGAVLVASITAALTGLVIFFPKIFLL